MNHQIHGLIQQAVQCFQDRNLAGAANLLSRVLQMHPKNFDALHILGVIRGLEGRHEEAKTFLLKASKLDLNNPHVYFNLAKAASELGRDLEAIPYHEKAIRLSSGHPEMHMNYGKSLAKLNRLDDAVLAFSEAIAIKPDYAEAFNNRGNALLDLKQHQAALDSYNKAIQIKPDYAEAFNNRGNALLDLKQHQAALDSYNKAIQIKPDYAEAFNNRGNALLDLKQHQAALDSYNKAIQIKPDYAEAFNNRGNALLDLKQHQAALDSYNKAIQIKPDYAEAFCSRGNSLVFLGFPDGAIDSYNKAIEIKQDHPEAFNARGNAYLILRKYKEAIASFQQAYEISPGGLYLAGTLTHANMQICDWTDYTNRINDAIDLISQGKKSAHPFFAMSITDNLEILKHSSQTWAGDRSPDRSSNLGIEANNQKIKIGYFSSDFRDHPVGFLTAELFELHDRNRFEIIGFSFGPNTQDETRKRLELAFDVFVDAHDRSDDEIVRLARSMNIDIAVDLNGHTQDSRTNIFAARVAPIQLSYIGFLGTMGASYMDYLIVDPVLVPDSERGGYQEKLIYLPSYQANDRKKKISTRKFTREELGLPVSGFVFCCFNNNFKITPDRFFSWMKILQSVAGSVLLIYAENEAAKLNLQERANLHGVDPSRLVFASKIPLEEYLARYSAADLFLDTFPYNAGTTASDALWTGLPVLTMQGRSIASRMASSLLTAIDLPELITVSEDDYINKAIQLATQQGLINDLRDRLNKNKYSKLLFDSPKFTQYLEEAYLEIYQKKLKGVPAEDVHIHIVH